MKLKALFIVVMGAFLLSALPVYAEDAPQKPASPLENAARLANEEKWDDALKILNEVLQGKDQPLPAYLQRGMVYLGKNNLDAAMADFEKAISMNSKFVPAYVGKSKILFAQGKIDQALKQLDHALEIDPKFALGYYNRGISYYYLQKFPEALKDLEKAMELGVMVEPDLYEEVWTMSNLPKVIAQTTEKISQNPSDAESYYNRGVAHYYQKDFAKALPDLRKAQELGVEVPPELMSEVQGSKPKA